MRFPPLMVEPVGSALTVAQEELSAAYDHLAQIVQAMPGALVVLREDGTITQINPGTSVLLEASAEQLLWHPVHAFLGPGHPTVPALFQEARRISTHRSRATLEREVRWQTTSGRIVPVLLSARLLGEERDSLICVILDLTAQKRLELQLLHAHKLEAMAQMATGVVHEISTPLQFMGDRLHFLRGALQELLEGDDGGGEVVDVDDVDEPIDADDPAVLLLEQMRKCTDSLSEGLRTVREIVSAVRGFSHPRRTQIHHVELSTLIESTLVVGRNAYKYVATAQVQCPPGLSVQCRPGDVRQILLALVVNAAQAIAAARSGRGSTSVDDESSPARGHIFISATRQGKSIELCVEDDGPGIPEQERARIFEPFFTTKPEGEGTGQGLAISRHLAEANGGRLSVAEGSRGGALFRLVLPAD